MELSENTWKTIDALVKLMGGGAITIAITLYGMKAETTQQNIIEANKRVQALVEITSKQKELDVSLGMQMLETMLKHYFQNSGSPSGAGRLRERMLLLNLMALNFHDVPIHLKPLFEQLDSQLTDSTDKRQLRQIAQEVARRQAFRLTFESGFDSGAMKVEAGKEISIQNFPFKVTIAKVAHDRVFASLVLPDRTLGPFSVSYFDMPLVDNTKVGNLRVSLILLNTDGESAQVRLVCFASDLAADRFDVKELAREIRATRYE